LILLVVATGCRLFSDRSTSSSDSLVGKWKVVRTNTSAQDTWRPGENESFEFFADGRFEFNGPGGSDRGTYITDTNVTPHRIVMRGTLSPQFIYKIEGNKLVIKASLVKGELDFPSDFGIQYGTQVMELERK
jgi:hypothetical protein